MVSQIHVHGDALVVLYVCLTCHKKVFVAVIMAGGQALSLIFLELHCADVSKILFTQ
jgi:hypothetical protein